MKKIFRNCLFIGLIIVVIVILTALAVSGNAHF